MRKSLFAKTFDEDEKRDAQGRWEAAMERRGVKLHGTTGILGLSREQVVEKIHRMLEGVTGETTLGHRLARYLGTAAGAVIGGAVPHLGPVGIPTDVTQATIDSAGHMAEHVREATGQVVGKVLEHPRFKQLATQVAIRRKGRERNLRKAFYDEMDPVDQQELKNILASTMADSRLPSQVNYSDAALTDVASGAYRQLCDRLGTLCASTQGI